MALFKLDGVPFKSPSGFNIEHYTLTKSTRVANGDMVMDYVANKRKFEFEYKAIKNSELNVILNILWTQLSVTRQCFHTLTYTENGVEKTATVYAGSIPKRLQNGMVSDWVWKDLSFSLIER